MPSDESIEPIAQAVREAVRLASAPLIPVAVEFAGERDGAIFTSSTNEYAIVLTSRFNCSVSTSSAKSKYFLTVNLGLAALYQALTRMFFTRISVAESEWNPAEPLNTNEELTSFEAAVRAAQVLMDAFWQERLPGPEVLSRIALSNRQALFCERSYIWGLRFAVAHELGHVMLIVSQRAAAFQEEGERFASTLLRYLDPSGSRWQPETVVTWGSEFAADRIGLELARTAAEKEPGAFGYFQTVSAEWFLLMCDMLWRYRVGAGSGSVDLLETHPPFHTRQRHLRVSCGLSGVKFDLGALFGFLAEQVLEAVCPGAPRIAALGSRDVKEQEAFGHYCRGIAAVAQRDVHEARDALEKASAIYEAQGNLIGEADCFLAMGRLHARLEEFETAANLMIQSLMIYTIARAEVAMKHCAEAFATMNNEASDTAKTRIKGELLRMGATQSRDGTLTIPIPGLTSG